jgi:hypothetical protein
VVVKQLGVGQESVRRWVNQAEIDGGRRQGPTSEQLAEIKALRAENRRLREDVDDPARGNNFLPRGNRPAQPLIMGFIDTMRAEGHAVESVCRVLRERACQVAAQTYRSWQRAGRVVAARTVADARVVDAVRDIAARAVAGWATEGSAHELFGVMRPANERAEKLARRLGMQWVGETDKYYDLRLQVFRSGLPTWPRPPAKRKNPSLHRARQIVTRWQVSWEVHRPDRAGQSQEFQPWRAPSSARSCVMRR